MKKKSNLDIAKEIAGVFFVPLNTFKLQALKYEAWLLEKESQLMQMTGLKKEEAKAQLDYLLNLKIPIDELLEFYSRFGKFPNEDEIKALRTIGFDNYCRLHFF